MNRKNKITRNHFFKKDDIKLNKTFLINACDIIMLENDDTKTISTGVYFKLDIKKKNQDLEIELYLYSWCNDKQDYVPLESSIWKEEGFGSSKYIPTIKTYYEKIIKNFLDIFKQLKYYWQLKELIHKLENPTFIFHYKLLNLFSKDLLEKLFLKHFDNYPILNIPLFKNSIFKQENPYIFIPNYISRFYMNNIEVNVDLDDSDIAVIEDDEGTITKEEFLERVI